MQKEILKQFPQLGSVADPNKISTTIRGLAVWLIPMIIATARMFEFEFTEADLTQLLNAVATAVASIMVVYGLLRKFYYTLKK